MRRFSLYICILTVNLLLIMLLQCAEGPSPIVDNGGSEVWGKVVDTNGVAIANAELSLYILNQKDSSVLVKTKSSDNSGGYEFDNLVPGTYTIYGNGITRNVVLFKAAMKYDSGRIGLGTDTMKAPGSITCVFTGAKKNELNGALCFIPKTTYSGVIYDDSLTIDHIYPSNYTLVIPLKPYDYQSITIDPLTISSAGDTLHIHVVRDTSGPPPAPENLEIVTIDTSNGVATVKWNAVKVSDINGYYVYRGTNIDHMTKLDTVVRDTVFSMKLTVDTSGIDVYNIVQVESVDKQNQSGNKSDTLSIYMPSPQIVKTLVTDTVIRKSDTFYRGDTGYYRIHFSNATRNVDSIKWYVVRKDSIVGTSHFTDVRDSVDSLRIIWGDYKDLTVFYDIYEHSDTVYHFERILTGSQMYPPDTWKVYPSELEAPRYFLSAVSSGENIFILGGHGMWYDTNFDPENMPDAVEYFDYIESLNPDSKLKAKKIGSLTVPRWMHSSVVYNGSIYTVGGRLNKGSNLTTIEAYDIIANKSKIIDSFPESRDSLPKTRFGAAVCVYGTKLILSGGSISGSSNSVPTGVIDAFDVQSGKWQTIGQLVKPRLNHSVVVCNGKMYVIGGIDASNSSISDVEIVDLETGISQPGKPMQYARSKFSAVSVNDHIYVFGGYVSGTKILDNVEMLDCSDPSSEWHEKKHMSFARYGTAAVLHKGKIYVIGGAVLNSKNPDYKGTIEIYYP